MPKAPITRVSGLEITPSTTNKNTGLFLDAITTVQRDAIPTKTAGLLISNSDTNTLQTYQSGAWTNLTTAPGVALYAPLSTTANAPAVEDGVIYYDTDTNQLTTGVNGAYVSVYTSPLAQGGNLVMQSLAADPAGGSSVSGEVYYNMVLNVIRARINGAWTTVNTTTNQNGSTSISFGAGLPTATAPFSTQPHIVGTLYFDTVTPKLWVCSAAGTPGTFVGVGVA